MTSFSQNVSEIVDDLELTRSYDKAIIKHRFLEEITYYEGKRDHTKKYYNAFRFIVTSGSILLPAILSMGQMDPDKLPANFDQVTYWTTWLISLSVTGSNGFLQLFSLDKNYFSYSMVVEQLKTEGWQFFGLSGKYEDYDDHQEAYKTFSKSIESIKRKQVEQEFSNGKGDGKKKKFDFKGEMKKFSDEHTNKPAQQPAKKPSEKPVEQSSEKPAKKPSEKPVEQSSEKPVEQSSEKPVEQPTTTATKVKEIEEKIKDKDLEKGV